MRYARILICERRFCIDCVANLPDSPEHIPTDSRSSKWWGDDGKENNNSQYNNMYVMKKPIDVTAAVIVKSGKVLAARRGPGKHLEGCWEFPGGKLEESETPEHCLQRELNEEFCITSRVGPYIGESLYDYGSKVVRLLAFQVEHISGDFQLIDHDELRWLALDELYDVDWAPADVPLVEQFEAAAKTHAYYAENARQYCEETSALEVKGLYERFLGHIPAEGHILDLGCGSGRDSKALRELGYTVTSVDGNPEIATWAENFTGHTVEVKSFQEIDYRNVFDGVWASASLLHCHRAQLNDVFKRVLDSLKFGGVAYMSFKWGEVQCVDSRDRYFTNFTTQSLRDLLKSEPDVEIIDVWESESILRGEGQKWSNAIIRKGVDFR